MNTTTDLSGFEVRTLKKTIVPFKTENIEGHYCFDQFGLFDVKNNSWVSLGSTCLHTEQPIPTQYNARIWKDILTMGLNMSPELGYALVPVSKTKSL